MGVLNFFTGTAGYTAILAAFGLAVAAHFFTVRGMEADHQQAKELRK